MTAFLARRYDNNHVVRVETNQGRIEGVEYVFDSLFLNNDLSEGGMSLPWIAPGLFDIQINGHLGVEFSSDELTEDGFLTVVKKVLQMGVFRFLPTVTTNSPQTIEHAFEVLAKAISRHSELEKIIPGFHLEGPFISNIPGPCGAHPVKYCRAPDIDLFDRWQSIAEGKIRLITVSPEFPDAPEFVAQLKKRGVCVSIGHTNATPKQIVAAIDTGARLSTHLSNGSSHMLPKKENYVFAQLAEDRLFASFIADGFHISPMLLRTLLRAKGHSRTILISDLAGISGLPPKKYHCSLGDVEILKSGKIEMADQPLLAGASAPLGNGLVNVMEIAGLSMKEAFELCTTHPSRLLGLPPFSNSRGLFADDFIAPGKEADFIVFRIQPAELGMYGVADTEGFRSGKLLLENVIHKGVELL